MKIGISDIRLRLTIVAFLVISFTSNADDFSKNYNLKFDGGIGFYIAINGIPNALDWTTDTQTPADKSHIMKIPSDAQFYSYGLDFSAGGAAGPLPPQLLGYGLSYMDMNGQVHGRWAARFVPVAGYDQKVYRIVFAGPYNDLKNDTFQYQFWAFNVPGNNQGYLFHFDTAQFAKEQQELRSFLLKILSNKGKANNGTLTNQVIGKVASFEIHFTSYNEKTGKVEAEVSGLNANGNMKFTGQMVEDGVGFHRLTLNQVGGDATWDLQLSDRKSLVGKYHGTYSKDGTVYSKEQFGGEDVEITLEGAPNK